MSHICLLGHIYKQFLLEWGILMIPPIRVNKNEKFSWSLHTYLSFSVRFPFNTKVLHMALTDRMWGWDNIMAIFEKYRETGTMGNGEKSIKFREQQRAARVVRNCEMYLTWALRDWRNHMLLLNFGTAVSFRDSSNALPCFWLQPKLMPSQTFISNLHRYNLLS